MVSAEPDIKIRSISVDSIQLILVVNSINTVYIDGREDAVIPMICNSDNKSSSGER